LCDIIKWANIYVSHRRKREEGAKQFLKKKMAERLPKFVDKCELTNSRNVT
jgi:hypothetical protein